MASLSSGLTKRWLVTASLVLVGIVGGYFTVRLLNQSTANHVVVDEEIVRGLVKTLGIPDSVARESHILTHTDLAPLSPSKLQHELLRYQAHQGVAREYMAQVAASRFIGELPERLTSEQLQVARDSMILLLEELKNTKYIGMAFGAAAHLDMHNDPIVQSLAHEVMASPKLHASVREFINQMIFVPASTENNNSHEPKEKPSQSVDPEGSPDHSQSRAASGTHEASRSTRP